MDGTVNKQQMMNKRDFLLMLMLIACFVVMSFKDIIDGQVVCFGDSITYGAKVDRFSWVTYLSKEHESIDFINAGRSGRKTSDREELLPVIKKYSSAKYYLIMLGVNDLIDGNDSMVNNCIVNVKWMIGKIREVAPDAKIVILSPPDINLKTMDQINIQKKYNQKTHKSLIHINKKYKMLAKENNTGFISLLHSVSKPNYADGLHPNATGQQQIAKAVWKDLKKLTN